MCRFNPETVGIYDNLPASGNIELLKIPNFLHLTPNVIKKQCIELKSKFLILYIMNIIRINEQMA